MQARYLRTGTPLPSQVVLESTFNTEKSGRHFTRWGSRARENITNETSPAAEAKLGSGDDSTSTVSSGHSHSKCNHPRPREACSRRHCFENASPCPTEPGLDASRCPGQNVDETGGDAFRCLGVSLQELRHPRFAAAYQSPARTGPVRVRDPPDGSPQAPSKLRIHRSAPSQFGWWIELQNWPQLQRRGTSALAVFGARVTELDRCRIK
jgi:hypothetical protein